jgi:APA family basic amino acid/polyamine antiporter
MGKLVQNLSTLSKVGGLGLMIALLLWSAHGHWPSSATHAAATANPVDEGWVKWGVALVAVLWAFEGWHVASFIAAEFKRTQRDLPRALMYGTLIVAAIYILANISYYMVLTPAQIASSDVVAANAIQHGYGVFGRNCISLLIIVSIFGASNGMILTGPRVYYAMAKDGLFLESFGSLNPRFKSPIFGLVVQGIWASLLTVLGTFTQLFTYVIFTAWIFYALAVAGVAVLRVREPNLKREFRAPALPLLVGGFVLASLGMAVSTIVNDPIHAMIGLGLILSGLPVYAIARWNKLRTPSPSPSAEG